MADLYIASPCRGVCRLGPDEICDGCGRSIIEIAAWARLDSTARGRIMERVADWTPRSGEAAKKERGSMD